MKEMNVDEIEEPTTVQSINCECIHVYACVQYYMREREREREEKNTVYSFYSH